MATVSAWNTKGQGPTSEEGGQQEVEYVPDEMHQPCGQRDIFKNIVNLNWDRECQLAQHNDEDINLPRLTAAENDVTFNGGSDIIGYVMQYKETDGPNEQDLYDTVCNAELIEQGVNCWSYLPSMDLADEEPYYDYTIDHSLEAS